MRKEVHCREDGGEKKEKLTLAEWRIGFLPIY